MKKLIFPIIVVLFALIICILFLIFSAKNNPFSAEDKKDKISTDTDNEPKESGEASEETNNQESDDNLESSLGGEGGEGGGGGGGSSSSGETGSGPASCPQVSYALRNFVKNLECTSYDNEICIEKNVYCSVKVENIDQFSGEFIIGIEIYDIETSEIIQQFEISKTVYASQQELFDKSITLTSLTSDGEANKDYDCSFKTIQIPKKLIC